MYITILALSLLLTIVLVCIAYFMEKNRKRKNIGHQPFMWGYYQGAATIAFSLIFSTVYLMTAKEVAAQEEGIFLLLGPYTALRSVLGVLILNRNRYALVANTVISFNFPIWLINFFYIKNRWHELGKTEINVQGKQFGAFSRSRNYWPRKICVNCERRFEVVRTRNAEDGEVYECYICKRTSDGRFVYEVTDDEIRNVYPGLVAR